MACSTARWSRSMVQITADWRTPAAAPGLIAIGMARFLDRRLAAPVDQAQLLLACQRLRRRRLGPSGPRWEAWFPSALPEGRVGLFFRTRHAMADRGRWSGRLRPEEPAPARRPPAAARSPAATARSLMSTPHLAGHPRSPRYVLSPRITPGTSSSELRCRFGSPRSACRLRGPRGYGWGGTGGRVRAPAVEHQPEHHHDHHR